MIVWQRQKVNEKAAWRQPFLLVWEKTYQKSKCSVKRGVK